MHCGALPCTSLHFDALLNSCTARHFHTLLSAILREPKNVIRATICISQRAHNPGQNPNQRPGITNIAVHRSDFCVLSGTAMHFLALPRRDTAMHFETLSDTSVHFQTQALQCTSKHCRTLRCTSKPAVNPGTAPQCTAGHFYAPQCTSMHLSALPDTSVHF